MIAPSGATLSEIETIYVRRGRDFYRFALARTASPTLAQEAVQEGFARAIRSRASFSRTGSLEAWIGRCVLNAAHDALSRETKTDAMGCDDEPIVDLDPSNIDVREALNQLPKRQRDVVFLRFYLDFEYAAIAETLGVEVGTVSATLHAARQRLAHTLQEVPR